MFKAILDEARGDGDLVSAVARIVGVSDHKRGPVERARVRAADYFGQRPDDPTAARAMQLLDGALRTGIFRA